jgi:flagellar protein FliS
MLHRYQETDIGTASPEALIVKLYDGALRFAGQARIHLQEGRVAERAQALSKALAIVSELQCALDHDKGGEIARNLDDLYDFVTGRLVEANVDGRIEAIDEALGVLETLAEAWREVVAGAAQTNGGPA